MKYDISHILTEFYPNTKWALYGNNYSDLDWQSATTKPSEEELNILLDQKQSEEAMRLLRIERDKKLAEIDWMVVKSYSRREKINPGLEVYMQELRDLPQNVSPTLSNDYRSVEGFDWPVLTLQDGEPKKLISEEDVYTITSSTKQDIQVPSPDPIVSEPAPTEINMNLLLDQNNTVYNTIRIGCRREATISFNNNDIGVLTTQSQIVAKVDVGSFVLKALYSDGHEEIYNFDNTEQYDFELGFFFKYE